MTKNWVPAITTLSIRFCDMSWIRIERSQTHCPLGPLVRRHALASGAVAIRADLHKRRKEQCRDRGALPPSPQDGTDDCTTAGATMSSMHAKESSLLAGVRPRTTATRKVREAISFLKMGCIALGHSVVLDSGQQREFENQVLVLQPRVPLCHPQPTNPIKTHLCISSGIPRDTLQLLRWRL